MERRAPSESSTLESRIRALVRQLAEFRDLGGSPEATTLLDEARRVLRASEDRYQRLVAHAAAIVAELLPNGTVLSVNDTVARVTGFRPAELIGTPWWDKLFPGEYRPQLWRLYRRLRKDDVAGYELQIQSKHRLPVTLEISTANVYGSGHRLEIINLFAIDITARRQAEHELVRTRQELQEKVWERTDRLERINAELQIEIIEREQFERALSKSEERFRRAVDNIPATVVIYDGDGRIRFVNARVLSQWDLSEREVLGSLDEELFPPSVTEGYLPALQRTLRTRRPQNVEVTFERQGESSTVMFSYVPLLDAAGDIEEVLGIGYDVTERRRIEQDLRVRHRELQTLNQISEIALTRRSLDEAYRDIVAAIRDALSSPMVAIESYDSVRQRLLCKAVSGLVQLPPERPPDGLASRVLAAGQLAVERREQGRSVIAVPLVVREQVIGLLTAEAERELTENDRLLQLLPSIANTVAIMTERQQAEEALRESEAQRARAEEFSLLMVARVDLTGRWLKVPGTLCRWLGYDEHELLAMREQEIIHPEDVDGTESAHASLRQGEVRSIDLEKRYLARDGRVVWAYVNTSVLPDAAGRPLHLLHFIRDITEQKRAEEELRLAARVFESSAEAIMILDSHRRIINVNQAFTNTTGFPPEAAMGSTARIFDSGRHPADFYRRMWERVADAGQWQGEVWGRRRNGDQFPALLNLGAVRDGRGHIINYVGIFRDITAIKRSQEELERLANFDHLTGLPNRNLFHDRLLHGIDRARRSKSRLAVLFIDLDNFKLINDTLGHDIGDQLLKRVAERLRRCVRSEDTVARLGGDEFVVVLEDVADVSNVADTAQRINRSLFLPMELSGHPVDITGSIGISVFPDDAAETGSLLKNADTAMYAAKEQGRNTYRFFTGGMNRKAVERFAVESALRRALQRREFFLVYQPQVSVHTGQQVGVEATIRWNHPERGVVTPDSFIPVAEATTLIEPIGEWVLREACAQLRRWNSAGFRVAVNLSGRQFRQRDFAERIVAIAQEAQIDPTKLEVELTESTLMHDPDEAGRVLQRLKDAGICIAIDDFGTGYSSLARLKQFPIDRLKIDRSFVHDLVSDPDDAAISTAIISMAHSLEVSVIAEGVETREQFDFLAAKGCDEVQGFLFSRPLAADQVPGFRV